MWTNQNDYDGWSAGTEYHWYSLNISFIFHVLNPKVHFRFFFSQFTDNSFIVIELSWAYS